MGHTINSANLQPVRIIGKGAYGSVTLMAGREAPEVTLAAKSVCHRRHADVKEAMRKEALLLRSLRHHVNVLKYVGMRDDGGAGFLLFLEYADGGELFDQIEPASGMPHSRARHYFKQLIVGLEYVHSRGVVHRDLKPDNLLLTKSDVLKISDFGMATIFRHGNKERYLNTMCGTLPYTAPEVFSGKYRGAPVDIWSSGVVLTTLLTGDLPWERPYEDNAQYQNWVNARDLTLRPWFKIQPQELSLLERMLSVDVEQRATISSIRSHPWFARDD